MRTTTVYQLPYPESPDHTRTWEYWQALAEKLDTTLAAIENSPKPITNPAMVSAEQSIAQSIPNNAWQPMAFDAEAFDTANMHSTSTQNSRLTCTVPGTYVLAGGLYIAPNATGKRGVAWWVNGVQTRNAPAMMVAANITMGIPAATPLVKLALNDYVEMAVFQDSTAALLTAASAGNRSWATARYVGP